MRDWRPSDHDHTDTPSNDQVQVDPSDAGAPAPPGLEDVTIVAWQQNCTQCHGQLGRGDGPRGPMVRATNLSDPAWQSAATDEQIARAIKQGKGAMPPSNLPDGTIANLVKLVRMMNAARMGKPPEGAGAAPSGAALPPGHPAVAAPSGAALPPGHPAVAAPSGAALPPGHPAVGVPAGGSALPPGHPAVSTPASAPTPAPAQANTAPKTPPPPPAPPSGAL